MCCFKPGDAFKASLEAELRPIREMRKARGMLERRWSAGCLWGLSQTDHGRVQPCWKRPERGGARELHDLVDMLAPLEDPLLTQIVSDTAEALEKAHAKQNSGKLREDDVQELFVSLLTALEAARPHNCLKPHDTHTTGLGGMPNSRPDLVVTDSESALAPHVVDYFEIEPVLAKESALREAAYQMDERRRQLKLVQPFRGAFWGCCGGLDSVQLWRFERDGAAQRSPLLPLDCHKDSAGLQAIVRFWCTPASQRALWHHISPPSLSCSRIRATSSP